MLITRPTTLQLIAQQIVPGQGLDFTRPFDIPEGVQGAGAVCNGLDGRDVGLAGRLQMSDGGVADDGLQVIAKPPAPFPRRNTGKALAYRAIRKARQLGG